MKPPRIVLVALPVAALAVALTVAWRARDGAARGALTASGTVEATETRLGFQVAGRVDSILVHEGDPVRPGDRLAMLDRSERWARRAQAAAQVDAAQALLSELERGSRPEEIQQSRAARDAARMRLEDATRDLQRTKELFDGGAVSRESLDKAGMARDVAERQWAQADDQARLVETGPRQERVAAARAQRAQAEAALAEHDAALVNMVIRAPFGGVVTLRHREPGEIVPAGSPVLTVTNRDDRWVRIYISERRIGNVRVGGQARITSDTNPDTGYPGEVSYVATEAEFTPKNVQTAEERVKLVYAVKVRITGDPGYALKPGMPADVQLVAAP